MDQGRIGRDFIKKNVWRHFRKMLGGIIRDKKKKKQSRRINMVLGARIQFSGKRVVTSTNEGGPHILPPTVPKVVWHSKKS